MGVQSIFPTEQNLAGLFCTRLWTYFTGWLEHAVDDEHAGDNEDVAKCT